MKISIQSAKIKIFSIKIKTFSMKIRTFYMKIISVRENQKFSRKCELKGFLVKSFQSQVKDKIAIYCVMWVNYLNSLILNL